MMAKFMHEQFIQVRFSAEFFGEWLRDAPAEWSRQFEGLGLNPQQ